MEPVWRGVITVVQVEEDEEAEQPLKPSPDADTHILFVQPTSTGKKQSLHIIRTCHTVPCKSIARRFS